MINRYANTPRLVLGFHGCEKKVADDIINLKREMIPSTNDYDWLGHGFYFWENDPNRALEFAKKNNKLEPAVIGAVIDLGNCLSLMERSTIQLLQASYTNLLKVSQQQDQLLPENTGDRNGHKLIRRLDCAVFENLHNLLNKAIKSAYDYDTVVGAFFEGAPAYNGTEIKEQSHIQICVRNINCIKGFFYPLK